MFKTIRDMLFGAFCAAAVGAAMAAVGTAPLSQGYQVIDGQWITGLAGGTNYSYQYGITAHAGGTQAAAVVLASGINMVQIGTVASSGDSVALPQCVAGSYIMISNAGGQTLDIYGNPTLNQAVSPAAADTINGTAGSSAYQLTNNTSAIFFCAKSGAWTAVKTA